MLRNLFRIEKVIAKSPRRGFFLPQQPVKTSKAQLRSLLARGHEQHEEDKARLARDLHDDVCQKLTALSIDISLLQKRLGDDHPETAKLDSILHLVGQINGAVRRVMNQLQPKILDEFGLVVALKHECQRLSKAAGRRIEFVNEAEQPMLAAPVELGAYRLCQEILSHLLVETGGRGVMQVRVRSEANRLCLELTGEPRVASRRRNGTPRELSLLNLQEAALRIGAAVELREASDSVLFVVRLPVKRKRGARR